MLNRFMLSALLITACALMSFSITGNVSQFTIFMKGKGGDTLTVTNPSAGTAVMSWSFAQPVSLTSGIIIEDVVHNQVVRNVQVSGTTYTATGLAAGAYRFTVNNGNNYVADELVVN